VAGKRTSAHKDDQYDDVARNNKVVLSKEHRDSHARERDEARVDEADESKYCRFVHTAN